MVFCCCLRWCCYAARSYAAFAARATSDEDLAVPAADNSAALAVLVFVFVAAADESRPPPLWHPR